MEPQALGKCFQRIAYKQLNDDIYKPEYMLETMIDPLTGFPVKYDITIPPELKGIISGEQPPFIKTMTTTLNTGRAPGYFDVIVRTQCDGKPLELRLPVLLRDEGSLTTKINCDIDFGWELRKLLDWVCYLGPADRDGLQIFLD